MAAAARSPLRWQVSPSGPVRQKSSISSAACARLQHLQVVATWASAQVPPLGAFLGSRFASACELLGYPPPPSPYLTCQRCESILQAGLNCSVRVKSRKKRKQKSVIKEGSPPVNSILYYCHYCTLENVKPGTPKAHVKTKLSEMAARQKLSALNKVPGEKMTKTSNNELMFAPKGFPKESLGSSGKRPKRKGWLSLKQLATSSSELSPEVSSKAVSVRPSISTSTPQVKILDSPTLVPKFSQVDSKHSTPASSIKGVTSFNADLELQRSNTSVGEIGPRENLSSVLFHRDSAILEQPTSNVACHSASPLQQERGVLDLSVEATVSSQCDTDCIQPIYEDAERQLTKASDSSLDLRHENVSSISVEKKKQLSCPQYGVDSIMLHQFTAATLVSRHFKSTFAAQNFSDTVPQMDMDIKDSNSSMQGVAIGKDLSSSSVSSLSHMNVSLADKLEDGLALKPFESPLKRRKGFVMSNMDSGCKPTRVSSTLQDNLTKLRNEDEKAMLLQSKKRKHFSRDKGQEISRKQRPILSSNVDEVKGAEKSDRFAPRQEGYSKMKPLFRRMGRHWLINDKSRRHKWRII